MTLRVFFQKPLPDGHSDLLREHLEESVELLQGSEADLSGGYQVLVAGWPERRFLEESDDLQALVVPWAGIPMRTRELLREFPQVSVHNLHHNSEATAEMALALLFAAARLVVPLDRALRQRDWTRRYDGTGSLLLFGKTALILGYGGIGQHVARVCQAMGMTILATRRHPDAPAPPEIEAEVHPPEALPDLLPRANVLVITLPQTAETEGLIGARELALLPENAILVNVGRGAIVEEEALYDALRNGQLHSAGLDVWYQYPEDEASRRDTAPSRFPFHELDNVVMSPHRGGDTMDIAPLRMAHLADLLNAAARGEEIPNRVDLDRGY
jgi:phosphoglycerate dehydrogenase-like enzyme